MTQRREPIRSRELLDSAQGQACDLNFAGVCNYNPETTVSCHIHDESFAGMRKADDTSTIHGCSDCHMFLDHGWVGRMEWSVVQFHIIRGMQRTLRNRFERKIIPLPTDAYREAAAKPVPARKPKGDRKAIPQRETTWPDGRKLVSRNDLRKPERLHHD